MTVDRAALVERVARAMCRERHPCWSIVGEIFERDHDGQATEFRNYATTAINLIRAETLEEAAVAAAAWQFSGSKGSCATSIRALKEK